MLPFCTVHDFSSSLECMFQKLWVCELKNLGICVRLYEFSLRNCFLWSYEFRILWVHEFDQSWSYELRSLWKKMWFHEFKNYSLSFQTLLIPLFRNWIMSCLLYLKNTTWCHPRGLFVRCFMLTFLSWCFFNWIFLPLLPLFPNDDILFSFRSFLSLNIIFMFSISSIKSEFHFGERNHVIRFVCVRSSVICRTH